MDPKLAAAAAAPGLASDTSDGEVGPARHSQRRSDSPSPSPTVPRSRSKSPSPNLRHSAAALSAFAVASGSTNDAGAGGRPPPPRSTSGGRSPRDHLDSGADADAGTGGRVPSPRRLAERSPRSHSHPDADAADRVPSPRLNRERTPRLPSDFNGDGASAGDASPLPRAREPSSRIKAADIKPISTRPMDVRRGSSQRRHAPRERHSPEYHKRPIRVWSPEDEVTILSALIEYRAKKGRLPSSIHDTRKLHRQIGGKLAADTSTETQLSDKIRRLKHKFKLLVTRAKHGRAPDLPTEHDRAVYELSKQVWEFRKSRKGGPHLYEVTLDAESHEEHDTEDSDEDMENGGRRREHTSKKPKASRFENVEGHANVTEGRASHDNASVRDDAEKGKQMYPHLWEAVEELCKEHPSGPVFRKAFGVLEKSRAIAMEEKLRNFKMSVIRQQLRRAELVKESVGKVLDAVEGAY